MPSGRFKHVQCENNMNVCKYGFIVEHTIEVTGENCSRLVEGMADFSISC